jgi:hydrogenase nickel incorporation protein HypA/HybF
MHELALSRAIVEAATRHAAGRPVSAVHVRVGAMRQTVPDSLAFYLDLIARGSACDGARFELEPVAALLRCPACAREWDPAPPPLAEHEAAPAGALPPTPTFACPKCGTGGEVLDGEQLEVDWIEVDEPTPGRRDESGRIASEIGPSAGVGG